MHFDGPSSFTLLYRNATSYGIIGYSTKTVTFVLSGLQSMSAFALDYSTLTDTSMDTFVEGLWHLLLANKNLVNPNIPKLPFVFPEKIVL